MLFKNKKVQEAPVHLTLDGFPDYIKKEIFAQRELIAGILSRYINAGKINLDYLKIKADKIKSVYIVSSYDSYCTALAGAYNFEVLADVMCQAEIMSEFNCSNPILDKHTLVVAIADNEQECLQVKERSQECNAQFTGIYNFADGDKRAVTLNFCEDLTVKTAQPVLQLLALTLLTLYIGIKKRVITQLYAKIAIESLMGLDLKIRSVLLNEFDFKELGTLLKGKSLLFAGSNVDFAVSLYAKYFIEKLTHKSVKAVPLGMLSDCFDRDCVSIFIASNRDFYYMLGNSVSLCIAPQGINTEKNIVAFKESIPLLNPLLIMICIQIIGYYIADNDSIEAICADMPLQ